MLYLDGKMSLKSIFLKYNGKRAVLREVVVLGKDLT